VRIVPVALIAVVGLLAVLLVDRGGEEHQITVVVPSAANLIPGQQVKAGREPIGAVEQIDPVDHGRAARLRLRIDDEAWPIPRDSRLEIRFGGTVSYGNRYILLTRGEDVDSPVPDGGALPPQSVKVPVEIDEVIATIKAPLRRDLKHMLDTSGPTVERMSPSLGRALEVAPGVIGDASGVLRDLSLNQATLRSLVRSTGSVVDAVDRSSPRLRVLLDGAAGTMDATAAESERLEMALTRLPAALDETRRTLPEADRTLIAAADLTTRLAPGVTRLRRISRPLNGLLRALDDVGPDATATLRTTSRKAPDITRLLARATTVAPQLEAIGRTGTRELDCIRPYTPEIVMLATTWGDFTSPTDGKDRYIRANIQNFFPAPVNNMPQTPAQMLKTHPSLEYGFPRPPGQVAGQPWFQPQCGAGPEALDPANDGEGKTFTDNLRPPWMAKK